MKLFFTLFEKPLFAFLLIFISSVLLHRPIFQRDLVGVHVWRQTQTQINIQQFYRHDNNILNPRVNTWNEGNNIRRMEFPIMQWLIAQVHRVLGEDIMITRICIFMIGLWATWGLYLLVRLLFRHALVAFLVAWSFTFSPVFYYYTLNPLPDNFALCMVIWSIYYFYKFQQQNEWVNAVASAFFLLIATLAKLPFILFGIIPFTYIIQYFISNKKNKDNFTYCLKFSFLFIVLIAPALAWYAWVIPTWNGNGVIKGIFDNQIPWEKTRSILYYHLQVMFPKRLMTLAIIPFFGLGVVAFLRHPNKAKHLPLLFGGLMIIFYFLYEINMIDIVHDYYMMPFLPYLFLTVAYGFQLFLEKIFKTDKAKIALLVYSLLAMPYICYASAQPHWSIEASGSDNSLFLYYEDLRKAVPNEERCIILNDISTYIFPYKVDKQCYIFFNDHLPAGWIKDMIQNKGVKYMYSDSRKVDENPEVQPYLDSLLLQRGTIKVFKLKK